MERNGIPLCFTMFGIRLLYPVQCSLLHIKVIRYFILLLGYNPLQHVTVLNTGGNCNGVVSIIMLWNHHRICGPSLTETSLCGAYLCITCHFAGNEVSRYWDPETCHPK